MGKQKETNKKRPFYLVIVLLLMVGIAASGIVFLTAHDDKEEKDNQTSGKMCTVTFCYDDGTIIEEKKVKEGEGVLPPEYIGDGVFRGWTAAINRVTTDIEVYPIIYDIVEDNLFYFESSYVQEGNEFSLDLWVGGNVSVSSGELLLEYDPDVLTYQKAEGSNSEVFQEDGKLRIVFSSPRVITEKTKLVSLIFRAEAVDAYSTELVLSAENVECSQGDDETTVDYATMNNKIYFLKEATR